MDFLVGGLAGAGATLFTNPLDVVKIRLQLQGELKSKKETITRYRGIFHGMYVIAKNDGALSLQKGLAPAMVLGVMTCSIRLGTYRFVEMQGWTKSKNGDISINKSILWSSISGVLAAVCCNPLAVLKTRLQAASHPSIAVGRQHAYGGVLDGAITIYKTEGLKGFYSGVTAAYLRMAVGSGIQLTTFSTVKEALVFHGICTNSQLGLAFVASAVSGVMLAMINLPLDLTSVRLFNQGSESKGKRLYKGVFDCLIKVYKKEGLHGLYKGIGPFYMRTAPHTTISLGIWDMLNNFFIQNKSKKGLH